jgi:hypothetical protein
VFLELVEYAAEQAAEVEGGPPGVVLADLGVGSGAISRKSCTPSAGISE